MLSAFLKNFLVNQIALHWLFMCKTLRLVSQKTNLILIIGEAGPVCKYEASAIYPDGYSNLDAVSKEIRGFGGSVFLDINGLGECSRTISSNATYHVILNQPDQESILETTRTLCEPQAGKFVSSQECGEAVFKEAMGPVSYGIPFKIDHVPDSDMPRPDTFDQHSFTPARGIDDIPGFRSKLESFSSQSAATTPMFA